MCQPDDPPGWIEICETTTSVPSWSGIVPPETSVPRARVMFGTPQEGRRQHEICAATVEYLKCLARHFDKAVAGVEGPDQTIPAQRDLPLQHGYEACPAVAVLRRLGAGSEIKGLLNEAVGAPEYG